MATAAVFLESPGGAPSFSLGPPGGLAEAWGAPWTGPAAQGPAHLSPVAEVLPECRLLAYISQVPTQMSFLFRLINIIHVQTLTQV